MDPAARGDGAVTGKRVADQTPDELFETGGGFAFADEVSAGCRRRITETFDQGGRGVMVNATELLWLVCAYEKSRGREVPL